MVSNARPSKPVEPVEYNWKGDGIKWRFFYSLFFFFTHWFPPFFVQHVTSLSIWIVHAVSSPLVVYSWLLWRASPITTAINLARYGSGVIKFDALKLLRNEVDVNYVCWTILQNSSVLFAAPRVLDPPQKESRFIILPDVQRRGNDEANWTTFSGFLVSLGKSSLQLPLPNVNKKLYRRGIWMDGQQRPKSCQVYTKSREERHKPKSWVVTDENLHAIGHSEHIYIQ